MPSPRKRKLKYAVGAVLRGNRAYGEPGDWSQDQKTALKDRLRGHNDTQQDIADGTTGAELVRVLKETLAHDPHFGGNKHKLGNFVDGSRRYTAPMGGSTRILNGLGVTELSDLDMCAYASWTYADAVDGVGGADQPDRPEIGASILLIDSQGTRARFVFGYAENNGDPGESTDNGDEILRDVSIADSEAILADGFANNFGSGGVSTAGPDAGTARRYLVACQLDDSVDDAWISFCYAVNLSPLRINAWASDRINANQVNPQPLVGRVHLVQLDPGPAGNTPITRFKMSGNADQPNAGDGATIIRWSGLFLFGQNNIGTLNNNDFDGQGAFTGGCRAEDALMFYGQLHRGGGVAGDLEAGPFEDVMRPQGAVILPAVPLGADNMEVITAAHGVCFLSNPMAAALNIAAQPDQGTGGTAGCGNHETIIIAPHFLQPTGVLQRGASPDDLADRRYQLHVKAIAALAPLDPGQGLEYTLSVANGDWLAPDFSVESAGPIVNDGALGVAAERAILSSSLTQPAVQRNPIFGDGLAPGLMTQVAVDGGAYLAIRSNVRQPDALNGDGSAIGLASNFRPVGGGIIVHWFLAGMDVI